MKKKINLFMEQHAVFRKQKEGSSYRYACCLYSVKLVKVSTLKAYN